MTDLPYLFFFAYKYFLFFATFFRKETGLERFVPSSLAESMKKKELRKLLTHFLKLNASAVAASASSSSSSGASAKAAEAASEGGGGADAKKSPAAHSQQVN